ncbi:class I SAM-dependent methyltransferase [Kitasatospora sp. NPDC048365]|uniref:class I SAM-dependent methyltransferase n=1 Tax=Kitasatospora sp. NPDC048365 TaxID=3364050 RepID=UPI003710D086
MKDPSLRRSLALFRAFRTEQSDPERFYGLLAQDAVDQVERHAPLAGSLVADVGGGAGHFTEAFRARGAHAYLFEPDLAELHARTGRTPEHAVVADGYWLPLADGAVDVCFSSNVLEHVPDPETFISEMVRVTRPGGLLYLSYTNWLSPWGGHETSPWHLLGADRARRRYRRRTGHNAKHSMGDNLHRVHIGPVLRHVRRRADVEIISARSRYWPFLAEAVVRVPGLREIASWNLLLVMRRTSP